jgi:hypothetical protein
MEKAKAKGIHIGRPRVTNRRGFGLHLTPVLEQFDAGAISRRHAAHDLGIGYATLKRILDKRAKELREKTV